MNDAAAQSIGLGIGLGVYLIVLVAIYLLLAYPLYAMGRKVDSNNAWFAFVPILNVFLMLEIAGKEAWWFILFLIPCVGFIFYIITWMGIAEAMDKPGWLGALMIVPILNVIMPFYFAFG
ncbi:MAG TPA: DUF5684 domain-containing protein [Fimbriimonadaceae bacterium]|nr:DUF5684 domain-containing protein [Fimbriimonadaceae bacterium]